MPKKNRKTATERQREYKERLREEPVKYEEYLRKEIERNKKRREECKLRSISELSDMEQRHQKNMEENTEKTQDDGEKTERDGDILPGFHTSQHFLYVLDCMCAS